MIMDMNNKVKLDYILPSIRESKGRADVKIKISRLLAIRWLKDVFLRFGCILENIGTV
jgi:hypothetical protein